MSKLFDYQARFKFRVWHKDFKRFMTKDEWYLDMDGQLNFHGVVVGEITDSKNRYVIEQCTGTTDVNGKLIYEGDIVKVKRCHTVSKEVSKNSIRTELVEDGEEVGHIVWAMFGYRWLVSYEWKRYDDLDDFNGIDHRHQIIGNIHENGKMINYGD